MRVVDETGDFVGSKQVSGLMLPRELEDEGPFYRVYPEGFIERWDGFTIPRPSYMSDSQTDMNRNFPSTWHPEPKQLGAGAFPTSEPESRGVTEFAVKHPNIFVWLCMHTFGGVYIRPMNDKVDIKMDPFDQAVFRQIERWGDKIVGYPTVSGFMEFTYEPETPLYGELANYAYVERGAIGFVCELWDFFKQVGFEVKRPFSKNYDEHTSREAIEKIAAWDRDHNQGRIVGQWKKVVHPQLGEVEVGGYDPLVGVQNPPLEKIAGICNDQSRFFLRVASMTPRLTVASIEQQRIGEGLVRVIAIVENRGWLPTYFLGSAQSMPESDPVRVALEVGEGTMLVSGDREVPVGSIQGWGGNDRGGSPMMARTANEQARRKVEWVVRGEGEITISARNTRVGVVSKSVKVPS
jgi:hypothetical protein